MAERKRTVEWSYFTAVNENLANCDVCRKAIRYCGNTTNIKTYEKKKKIKEDKHTVTINFAQLIKHIAMLPIYCCIFVCCPNKGLIDKPCLLYNNYFLQMVKCIKASIKKCLVTKNKLTNSWYKWFLHRNITVLCFTQNLTFKMCHKLFHWQVFQHIIVF